jgi:Transcription elongation factor
MQKAALLKAIVQRLVEELDSYVRAAQAAHAEATHEQSRAESKYDTRGLEASYLARGQSRQASEIEASIKQFQEMEVRAFGKGDLIDLGALVELEQGRERDLYFIGPRAGGTELEFEGREILVITPQSPLGSQLAGKKAGDRVQLNLGGTRRAIKVLNVW